MTGLVDIHAHILPGIDDGPDNLEESIDMARAAVESGITTLAATPHLRSDFPRVHVEELADRVAALQSELASREIPLRLVVGAETSLVWALEASDEDLRLASYGQRGKDLLIETPSAAVGGLGNLLYQVRVRGYRVTLAHPERSRDFQRDPGPLFELAEQGVLLEVNAESFATAAHKSGSGRLGRRLCAEGAGSLVASDGHRGVDRRPVVVLDAASEELAQAFGSPYARWLTEIVPSAVLDGRQLPDRPTLELPARRRRRFSRR